MQCKYPVTDRNNYYKTYSLTQSASLTDLYLIYLNKKHAKKRQALGESADIVHESMMAKHQFETSKAMDMEDTVVDTIEDTAESNGADKGFSDITDLENEDFIYVY